MERIPSRQRIAARIAQSACDILSIWLIRKAQVKRGLALGQIHAPRQRAHRIAVTPNAAGWRVTERNPAPSRRRMTPAVTRAPDWLAGSPM